MLITLTGKIVACLDKKTGVSKMGKEWSSQDYVIEDKDGKILCFNVFGEENIQRYNLMVGTNASVECELESREWNGRYFTSLKCQQCFTEQNNQVSVQQPKVEVAKQNTKAPKVKSELSDLPF